MENQELSAKLKQELEVIRLEKILASEMNDNFYDLIECPSYSEYKKQMDILAKLVDEQNGSETQS